MTCVQQGKHKYCLSSYIYWIHVYCVNNNIYYFKYTYIYICVCVSVRAGCIETYN